MPNGEKIQTVIHPNLVPIAKNKLQIRIFQFENHLYQTHLE